MSDDWNIFTGEGTPHRETEREKAKRIDQWLADAGERSANLKRRRERGEPIAAEGYHHRLTNKDEDEAEVVCGIKLPREKATLLATRMLLEDANQAAQAHRAECSTYLENVTGSGKLKVCKVCVQLTARVDFLTTEVITLAQTAEPNPFHPTQK